jgi:hypothetical protein
VTEESNAQCLLFGPQTRVRIRHLQAECLAAAGRDCVKAKCVVLLSCTHRARMSMRFRELTLWAISAAKLLLCMRRRSTSFTLYTRNFLRPFGRR